MDRGADHISIAYGESRRAVALIAPHKAQGFTVQFLLKARRTDPRVSRILDEVRRELSFYLLDVVGPDSWPFVQYHCETPANRRSIVHWSWHPRPVAPNHKKPRALLTRSKRRDGRSDASAEGAMT